MATLAVQDATTVGITPTYNACAGGGDQFPNDGRTMLHFKNTSGGNITVTFVSQRACDQGTMHSPTLVVPLTTGDKMAGPFDPARFNDASGNMQLTYSGVTNLTVAIASL